VRGIHTCLVAEIRYQPGAVDPIPNGATPASSDRLSQRNLSIAESDNPGSASTHVVSHTLMIKPSQPSRELLAVGDVSSAYDELVIRWNDIPANTSANLYFPSVSADPILDLAASLRPGPQLLTKVDANTIACAARDTTSVPVPRVNVSTIPGLLTLQLPLTVMNGQQFRVDVQQHSGPTFLRSGRGGIPLSRFNPVSDYNFSQRRVLGAFRMTVVVEQGDQLIGKIVGHLAVLKFIQLAIPAEDPWSPIFVRYIGTFSDQLSGLGINPILIPPSQDDPGIPGRFPKQKEHCYTGKVSEVIFDCFGDFSGFVLETCEQRHHFITSGKGIGELALRACEDQLLISVCGHAEGTERILRVIVRRRAFP
jgi:hypothetical protein